MLDTSRNICIQSESVQKQSKLKDSLNKVSVEIKKLLDEIGYFDKINISQKSLYEISNLLKEHLFQT